MRSYMNELARAILSADSIALCSHVAPDGDTIGSALALRLALLRLGKRVTLFDRDKVPDNLLFLPGADEYRFPESLTADERFDLMVAVDVSDEKRLGSCALAAERCARRVQVDHHGTNPGYCEINVVDGAASACALPVRELIGVLGVSLDRDMAICLYTALSTDTGNFAFGNTTPEAFRTAAELLECDLPLAELQRVLFLENDPAHVRLLACALSSLRFEAEGQVTSMVLTMRDCDECGALPEHADNIVNYGLNMTGVKMALLARESSEGTIKCSLRAVAPCAISGVAASFGGGGHAQAAGCTVPGKLEDIRGRVTAAMSEELRKA